FPGNTETQRSLDRRFGSPHNPASSLMTKQPDGAAQHLQRSAEVGSTLFNNQQPISVGVWAKSPTPWIRKDTWGSKANAHTDRNMCPVNSGLCRFRFESPSPSGCGQTKDRTIEFDPGSD